ncbi:MAG: FlgD immunoglobulin-like domain containing protein [Candidatus Zixiibacteriota bacterium]
MTKNHVLLLMIILIANFAFGYGFDTEVTTTETTEEQNRALSQLPGKVFMSRQNSETGTIHRTLCSIPWEYEDNRQSAIDAAGRFISEYPEIFGISNIENLKLYSAKNVLGKWFLTYRQAKDGYIVLGSRVDIRLDSGNIVLFGSDVFDISDVNTSYSIDEQTAISSIENRLSCDAESNGLFIVKNSDDDLIPAWWIDGKTDYPTTRPRVLLDANTGEIIDSYDNIRYILNGTAYGEYIYQVADDGPDTTEFAHLFVSCDLGIIDTTDVDGFYSFDVDPRDRIIYSKMEGLYANVTMPGGEYSTFTTIATGTPFDFLMAYDDFYYQELNGYYQVTFIHDWYKLLDPEFDAMDYSVPVVVRDTVPPTPVNAFWDGEGIHMGRGGSGYDDFSYYAEIFYHEYTHGVTHFIYPGELLPYNGQPGAIDEALSDYFACTITDDPNVGDGGLVPGGGMMRTMDNDLVFPDDWEDEVHADGRIMGGAFWDLRASIDTTWCDTLIHFARFAYPNTFDDFAWEVLIMDDDDGDLSNGTPHIMEIFNAFSRHGIGNFETRITHVPYHDTEITDMPYIIEANIRSIFPLNSDSILVHYRLTGETSWSNITMAYDDISGSYLGEIPPVSHGNTVEYFIEARDSASTFDFFPDDAPEEFLSFDVGIDEQMPAIYSELITDQMLEMHPFNTACYVEDNYGIGHVELIYSKNSEAYDTVRMTADTTADYSGIPARYDGKIELDGLSIGDTVYYKIDAYDLAAEPNIASFPEDYFAWFLIVPGMFFDFEESGAGFSATAGWEWGIPSYGPSETPSGEKCWGTVLDGDYVDNANYVLESPEFETASYTSATLEFQHWMKIEWAYDGGYIEVSTDDGASWNLIHPVKGYPSTVASLSEWGFTGMTDDNWETAAFDLTNYIGEDMKFRLSFASDGGLAMDGWYIDNFAIMEKQVLLPPKELEAENGHDNEIPISWTSPFESGLLRPMESEEFTGFKLYRSSDGETWPEEPIATLDISDTEYLDRDVINGEYYYYRLTSIYDRGESKPTEAVQAMAFNAELSVYPDEFDILMYEGEILDTTMYVENIGSGWLDYLIIEESEEPLFRRSLEDYRMPFNENLSNLPLMNAKTTAPMDEPTGDWMLIATDPDEPGDLLDFSAFYAQVDERNIFFMTTAHEPMGDYTSDFMLSVMMDTDLDPETGMEGTGAEYFVALGALPMGNALILKYNPDSDMGFDMVGTPHYTYFSESGDTVQVGIRRSDIESPEDMNVYAIARPDLSSMIPEDMVPDEPAYFNLADILWIDETPKVSTVWADSAANEVTVTFDATHAARGIHHAWLKFETNDHEAIDFSVPIVLEVWGESVEENVIPNALEISSAYPNPFNAKCRIDFDIPERSDMNLEILDINGRVILQKHYLSIPVGKHSLVWDGSDGSGNEMTSGIYFIKIDNGKESVMRNVILLK